MDLIMTSQRAKMHRAVAALVGDNAPTPERQKHDRVEPIETIAAGVKAHRVQDPLDRYLARGEIDQGLYDLAREYGDLRWKAGFVPHAKAQSAERIDGSHRELLPSEVQWQAQRDLKRLDAGIAKLSGRRRAERRHLGVLAAVCGEGRSAAEWAWANGHRRNGQGLAILKDALRVMARVKGRR